MSDGARPGYQVGAEAIVPPIEEIKESGGAPALRMPTDEELGQLAADAWTAYQSRGYAHIEPREAFLHGYAMACRGLLAMFQPQEEVRP